MIETSGHLPECGLLTPHTISCSCENDAECYHRCRCDRLRACEQRVRAFYEAEIEKQGLQWTESCKQYYRSGSDDGKALGYAAALDAARDSVAALQSMTGLLGKADALAAIDALRGDA